MLNQVIASEIRRYEDRKSISLFPLHIITYLLGEDDLRIIVIHVYNNNV